jgi:acetyl-CoA synthetase
MFEGVPTYPDAGRFWEVCEKHKVNQFYTAPTAIRALMGQGDEFVKKYDLSSLKLLGTVGEPINPEAWNWYNEVVGRAAAPSSTPGGRPKPAATPDHPAARRHATQARLGHCAVLRRAARPARPHDPARRSTTPPPRASCA